MNIKNGALLLFIILMISLLLCSVLGGNYKEGYTDKNTLKNTTNNDTDNTINNTSNQSVNNNNYDNYDHYSGSSSPTKYYGPNGGTATITPDDNNSHIITVTNSNGKTVQYTLSTNDNTSQQTTTNTATNSISSIIPQLTNKIFYGPNGGSARLFTGKDNQYAIEETQPNGNTIIYTSSNTYTYNYDNSNSNSNSNFNSLSIVRLSNFKHKLSILISFLCFLIELILSIQEF